MESKELRLFVPRPTATPLGMGLPRLFWERLNRFCTGVEEFQSSMHKWRLNPTSICECAALDQTQPMRFRNARYIVPQEDNGLLVLDDETRCWLNNITANIWRAPPIRTLIPNFSFRTITLITICSFPGQTILFKQIPHILAL